MSNYYGEEIDEVYGIPKSEISCPDCGRKYGHHKTLVDIKTQICSSCLKNRIEEGLLSDLLMLNIILLKQIYL
jgi:hypothetical protein